MKTTTIREFRSKIAELIAGEDSVIVTRHGKPAAVLFSLRDPQKIPAELRKKLYVAMATEIAKQLDTKKVSDKQLERDFREYQKRRRR